MEELPPLVPDLTAWFEALLARVAALEARSEQGGAAATAKAEAQDQALQDLQKQKEADAVAMTSMREALAERESELAAMRQEMDSIRADLAARGERLPLDLDLGPAFAFHSTFTCPISKELAAPGNPPVMLPCGHVLALSSITKLARGSRTHRFKCPYCPAECSTAMAKQLLL